MSQNWELQLLDAASEYIPGYGEIYSFRRARHAAEVGDKESEFKFITTLGIGVVRDATLLSGGLSLPATVVFSAIENMEDKVVNTARNRHRILFPYEDETKIRDEKEKFFKDQTQVAAEVYFRRAVFVGKLDYEKTNHGEAKNENIFLTVPDGLANDAPCQITTTINTDAESNLKRPLIYASTKMQMNISKGEFTVTPTPAEGKKPYSWFGIITTPDKTKPEESSIKLDMKADGETITHFEGPHNIYKLVYNNNINL